MKGSWAGAMGQPQFMPSSYLKYAEDYDHDGKRDIWGFAGRRLRVGRELSEAERVGAWRPVGPSRIRSRRRR